MSIIFISDVHLKEKRQDIMDSFLYFLNNYTTNAESLYILGDFFDFWIGDDAMQKFENVISENLKKLSNNGINIYIMHGNRDFLLGDIFCQKTGCILIHEISIIKLYGNLVLLMHGDILIEDKKYILLRYILRNKLTNLIVKKYLPLNWRYQLAIQLRKISNMTKTKQDIVNLKKVKKIMMYFNTFTLIHGHTHTPAIHYFYINKIMAKRIVLGDWIDKNSKSCFLEVDELNYNLVCF